MHGFGDFTVYRCNLVRPWGSNLFKENGAKSSCVVSGEKGSYEVIKEIAGVRILQKRGLRESHNLFNYKNYSDYSYHELHIESEEDLKKCAAHTPMIASVIRAEEYLDTCGEDARVLSKQR